MAEDKIIVDCAGERVHGVQDYALIGNLRTAAIVSITGSIESMCMPYFDSPSVFARVVDADKGTLSRNGLNELIATRWPFLDQAYLVIPDQAGVCPQFQPARHQVPVR